MRVVITVETGNDAMMDMGDVLAAITETVRRDGTKVMDANGNSVGTVEVTDG